MCWHRLFIVNLCVESVGVFTERTREQFHWISHKSSGDNSSSLGLCLYRIIDYDDDDKDK